MAIFISRLYMTLVVIVIRGHELRLAAQEPFSLLFSSLCEKTRETNKGEVVGKAAIYDLVTF